MVELLLTSVIRFSAAGLSVVPAESLFKPVRVNWLEQVIKGGIVECLDCILIMGGCENDMRDD